MVRSFFRVVTYGSGGIQPVPYVRFMIKLHGSVVVKRPVGEVFAALGNLERSPDWARSFGVIERRRLTEGPLGVGTRFYAKDRLFGKLNEFELDITEYETDRHIAANWTEPIGGGWRASFQPLDGSTRVDFDAEMRPSGILKPAARLVAPLVRRATNKDLERFKAWVESGDAAG